MCKKIIEIDQGTSHLYTGSYEEYQVEKIKRYEVLLKHYNRQQKDIEHLQSFVDRFRYNSKKDKRIEKSEFKIIYENSNC